MPDYAIRVELEGNPTWDQYQALHQLMANYGFYQTIRGTSDTGEANLFTLPHAMYFGSYESDHPTPIRNILSIAIRAQIQNNILIFVVKSENWSILAHAKAIP
ncbi:MAG TPA: hypothetical protein VGQ12_08130 [Candidatus Angelobacter sp.]|jgi:hypothetical protein|nr:hypothetical protein [Candidatus Angelobacter sp.]